MVVRHADDPPVLQKMRQEKTAVFHIKQYIHIHYTENFSIEDLAQVIHLSPYHIIHIFREEMGVPPHAYLRQIRVRKAKELLTTERPIVYIARIVGFTDQSHLNRWFKRILGITPGQYRNSVQYK